MGYWLVIHYVLYCLLKPVGSYEDIYGLFCVFGSDALELCHPIVRC